MDTQKNIHIVIWGADNYNTLGLLRSLSVADFDITLVVTGRKQSVATASKYCKKYFIAHSIQKSVEYMVENFPEQNDNNKKAFLFILGNSINTYIMVLVILCNIANNI